MTTMRLSLLLMTLFLCAIPSMAQLEQPNGTTHIILTNGATISSSFNQQTGILSVEVNNNDDEVEVIVVEDDTIIDSESTVFEEDELQVEVPENVHSIDVYVRTKEETRYVGSVSKRE